MAQTVVEKIAQAHWPRAQRPAAARRRLRLDPAAPRDDARQHRRRSSRSSRRIGADAGPRPAAAGVRARPRHPEHRPRRTSPSTARSRRSRASTGIDFYPAGSGIGHQIMVRAGLRRCPARLSSPRDSHSNMYGALGALGTPVVRTDAAAIWATGESWWQVPRTVQVVLEGQLRRRRDRQGRHHRAVRPLQPGRGAQRRASSSPARAWPA